MYSFALGVFVTAVALLAFIVGVVVGGRITRKRFISSEI